MSGGLKRVATWYFRVEGGTPDAKRRARTILSSIVAIQCSWMLFATLALELAPEGRAIPSIVVAAIAGLVSVVAAALTRRGNVDAGGLLLSGSLSVLVACYQLYVGTYTGFLWFLALSVVLGSVSLRPVFILFIGLGNLLLVAALAILLPGDLVERLRVSTVLVGLLLPTTVLTYYSASRTRTLLLTQEATMIELQAAKDELVDANTLLEQRVGERTADLETKNEHLREALANLQRAQEQLVQSEKMASLGMVVGGVAHELKNPLNFVNNFAELSLEYATELEEALAPGREGGQAPAEILVALAENLRRIATHGRRADAIVSAMQLHGRSGEGVVSSVDLNDFVRDHASLAFQGFRARHPSFECEQSERMESGIGAVSTKPVELSRVIVNLVDNACYAVFHWTKAATGFSPRIEIGTRVDGDAVVVEVTDNGPGVPEAARLRVFDPFFTTKPPGEGTGLGLSASYETVVKQLGGRLEVEASPSGGALFRVRLPAERERGLVVSTRS